ncbi:MAG: photosynthetic reaction center cytochrome c subunit family protein [Pyrinomonadaceae bacterium]
MRTRSQKKLAMMAIAAFAVFGSAALFSSPPVERQISAQVAATPTPAFDQAAALAKLKEQIKGKEKEPAETVFKNIQMPMFKGSPAGRVLAVMEFGYARSLGVDCTHCHVPDKWESEDKQQKQIARDMQAMVFKIGGELLPGIKNLKTTTPTINCTTCHRGEIKPALNLPAQPKS